MISKKVQDAFNAQIKEEIESAYLYLSMAAHFNSVGLDGMAQWMRAQVKEELVHAMKFFDFINDRDGVVELQPIGVGRHKKWASALEAFQAAYGHEQYITGKINDLVKLAAQEKDNAASVFLQWFVSEQVEEEASTSKIAHRLEMIGDSVQGLLMLDQNLGQRSVS